MPDTLLTQCFNKNQTTYLISLHFSISACIFFLGHEDYYDHTAQELYGPVVSLLE